LVITPIAQRTIVNCVGVIIAQNTSIFIGFKKKREVTSSDTTPWEVEVGLIHMFGHDNTSGCKALNTRVDTWGSDDISLSVKNVAKRHRYDVNSLVNHFSVFDNSITTVGILIERHDRGSEDCGQMSLLPPCCKSAAISSTILCQTLTIKGHSSVGVIALVSSRPMYKVGWTILSITFSCAKIQISINRYTLMHLVDPGCLCVSLRGHRLAMHVRAVADRNRKEIDEE
jgi:hypothetical protein